MYLKVSKLFRAYGLYNRCTYSRKNGINTVSKLFRAYGLYNDLYMFLNEVLKVSFKALSSLRVI